MHIYLAAGPPSCDAGSWLQQFKCGWNQGGHSVADGLLGWVIVTLFVFAVAWAVRKMAARRRAARSGSAAPARTRGRARAGARW